MNQASNYIDLLHWMIGAVESVMAYTATLARNIEVEDSGFAAIRWRNGAMGTLNVTMLTLCHLGLKTLNGTTKNVHPFS